jgi:2-oxoglutarate dehydrogenase E2 component (dihydrolipoamide succinyltransferase)
MATLVDVRLPAEQSEGTRSQVLRWCRAVGDAVAEHQPLVELETDKVTIEVPAPVSGTLAEISQLPGNEVAPGEVLGRILVDAEIVVAAVAPSTAESRAPAAASAPRPVAARLSPAVRRLVAEHGLDATSMSGSGKDGRLTAQDVTRLFGNRAASAALARPVPDAAIDTVTASGSTPASRHVKHSAIRRRIALHMAESLRTAPHVTTVFEADLARIVADRDACQQDFARRGVKLTLTAYFVAAAAQALQVVPEVNSVFHANSLEIFADCNVGVATALGNDGLIVPVIHRAQQLDLFGIAKRLEELVGLARTGRLPPEAVRGGTFTISNHGVSGSVLAAPIIINQPQVAILGVGRLTRRAVVTAVDGIDALSIRPMCYLTLTIDHRALDAFQANAFLTATVRAISEWPGSGPRAGARRND